MKIRFDFKKECYCIDLARALIFSGVLTALGVLVCFCSGGTHIYSILLLPRFAPSRVMFMLIFGVMLALMGIALEIALASCRGNTRKRTSALTFFGLSLIVGYMWFPLFFGAGALFLSFAVCVAESVILFVTFRRFLRLCPPVALITGAYFVWMLYFSTVNFCIFVLN